MKRLIITVLCSSLLISCGESETQEDPVTNDLLGTWKASCFIEDSDPNEIGYISEAFEFKEDKVIYHFTLYSSSLCENVVESASRDMNYTLGEQVSTSAGNIVTNIDMTVSGSGYVIQDIFKIEQSYLYFGQIREDDLRSDVINFDLSYEKQY